MIERFRQNRVSAEVRNRVRENHLVRSDFTLPLFCVEGSQREEPIPSLDGVYRLSEDNIVKKVSELIPLGLSSVLLFPIPDSKEISTAWSPDGVVQRVIGELKKRFPDLRIIADVCICAFTKDGHCHIGDNDETCKILAKIALSYARAGASAVAPSDMMDGRVWHIRDELRREGFNTPIISYAAKYASACYGPFRDATACSLSGDNRKGYQMDCANGEEAFREISADISEGAGSIIIKPAMMYADIIRGARDRWPELEIVAYQVSGEYAMINSAVKNMIIAESAIYESLISLKRSGTTGIITYFTEAILRGDIKIKDEDEIDGKEC